MMLNRVFYAELYFTRHLNHPHIILYDFFRTYVIGGQVLEKAQGLENCKSLAIEKDLLLFF